MRQSKMPDVYIGKEQAYVKHTILKTYLQRLFMIIGQGSRQSIMWTASQGPGRKKMSG